MAGHSHIERWSLAMHRRVADRIQAGDADVLRTAASNLERWRRMHGELSAAQAEWVAILAWPVEKLVALLRDADDPEAVRLRSNSPFAGVIDGKSRIELLHEARSA